MICLEKKGGDRKGRAFLEDVDNIQMSEKSTVNMMSIQKTILEALKKPQGREVSLATEYKLLLLYSAKFGVYVMPQLDSLDTWHGVLFVRFGIFKDAKLKFKITFENFPRCAPRVFFISEVYHPLVSTETGELDLGEEYTKNWSYGSDHLVFNVVQYIRLAFLDVKKYEINDSFNKKAGELYRSNIDEFFVKVRECVETSKIQVYNNYPETTLKFMPFNERHKKLREHLSQICEDQGLSQQQKKKKFMRVLKE